MAQEYGAHAWRRRFAVVVAAAAFVCTHANAQQSQSAPSAPTEETDALVYQLRPGEDPSKVARMFHLTVEELLAANHISDPHRLAAGTNLTIPDPRAARLAQMRSAKENVERQLLASQGTIATMQNTIGTLQGQVADLTESRDSLEREAALSGMWRLATLVAAAVAIGAAFGVFVLWAKVQDEARRRRQAVKEAEVLQVAVEKHRQLSGQFELRYQSLFHQVGLPATVQTRAQALRQAYDEDRARLDAIVEDAERAIKGTAAATGSTAGKRSKAHVTPLAAVRKNN